jgi:hypothetical protein
MAEKLILVCDLCGRNAVGQRTLDVCGRHDATPEPRKVKQTKKVCRYCGEECGSGAGLVQHVKFAHPKRWKGAGKGNYAEAGV